MNGQREREIVSTDGQSHGNRLFSSEGEKRKEKKWQEPKEGRKVIISEEYKERNTHNTNFTPWRHDRFLRKKIETRISFSFLCLTINAAWVTSQSHAWTKSFTRGCLVGGPRRSTSETKAREEEQIVPRKSNHLFISTHGSSREPFVTRTGSTCKKKLR